jgi:hypothetical protein
MGRGSATVLPHPIALAVDVVGAVQLKAEAVYPDQLRGLLLRGKIAHDDLVIVWVA